MGYHFKGQYGETNDRAIRLYTDIMIYFVLYEIAPSIRDIRVMIGTPSTSVAHYYLDILRDWGWISRPEEQGARNWVLTRPTEIGLTLAQLKTLLGDLVYQRNLGVKPLVPNRGDSAPRRSRPPTAAAFPKPRREFNIRPFKPYWKRPIET